MKGLLGGEPGLGSPTAYYEPPNVALPRLSLRASMSYLIVKTERADASGRWRGAWETVSHESNDSLRTEFSCNKETGNSNGLHNIKIYISLTNKKSRDNLSRAGMQTHSAFANTDIFHLLSTLLTV